MASDLIPDITSDNNLTATQNTNQIAYQNLYNALSVKDSEGDLINETFLSLLQNVPSLIEEIKSQASEITVLVPKNEILLSLPNSLQAELVKDAKSNNSNNYLYHLLKNHIVKITTTLDNNQLPPVIELDNILIPNDLKPLIEKYTIPPSNNNNLQEQGQQRQEPGQGGVPTLIINDLKPKPPPPTPDVSIIEQNRGPNRVSGMYGASGNDNEYSLQGIERDSQEGNTMFLQYNKAPAPPIQQFQAPNYATIPPTPVTFQSLNLEYNRPVRAKTQTTVPKWLNKSNLNNNWT